MRRFLPYWHDSIAPVVQSGARVIIAAHGNSLRALVKYLDNISEDEIVELNIPTGVPLVYELDADHKPIRHEYLGDPEEIRKAQEAVAMQGRPNKEGPMADINKVAKFSADLAAAINRVALDKGTREQFGRKGRRRVEDHFSSTAIAQRSLELYRSL